MLPTKNNLRCQNGAVSILMAAGAVPLVFLIGLLIDTGFAWNNSGKAATAAQAAAAAATLALASPCVDPTNVAAGSPVSDAAIAAFSVTYGAPADSLALSCEGEAVRIEATVESPLIIMSLVRNAPITVRTAAKASLAGDRGWSHS